ncbi:putative G-protein coupled receptor 34 [Merluccius polli]|uniref:Probable G-protein coupled receptor 34 n=1 Tax=Merluccius polli TaxID=89951 RepID=A0AA47M2J4_MERPO|nr:putative G-protein coupled receptor 34 [Merluccius polli]
MYREKGRHPERRIKRMTPQPHTSTGLPYGSRFTTSGAMKAEEQNNDDLLTAYFFTTTAMMAFPFKNYTSQDSQAMVGVTPNPGPLCPSDNSTLRILLTLFYSLFFILGLTGNLLALWVFLRVHSMKNSVRVLFINVALADLLLVACLPFRVWYHGVRRDHWELGATMCRIVGNFFYMNMYISITLLGLLSVDRYLKITRGGVPRQRQHRQHRLLLVVASNWSTVTCALIWVLAFAVTLLLMLTKETHKEINRCFQYKQLLHAKWKGYVNLMLVVVFWITYCAMVVSHVKIAFKLLRMSKENPNFPNALRYTRIVKNSFFILFLFTVCFVPYHIVRLMYIITQVMDTSCYWMRTVNQVNEIALLFSALNSCLDPVMYVLLSSELRKQVMKFAGSVMQVWLCLICAAKMGNV